jgi:hypothetical protein
MAQVTLNGVEIYLDTRTETNWQSVSKLIPQGFVCVAFVGSGNDIKAKIKIGDGTKTFSQLDYIGGDIDMADVTTAITTALADYYTKSETYTKTETDNAITAALSSVWKLKGRVNTVADLPASGNKTGDIYLVGQEADLNKPEYYWTGTAWEFMGQTMTIDLSLDSASGNPVANSAITAALNNKVDKVSGKGLSTNDYTTAEKEKLAGIAENANYTVVDSALSDGSTNPVQNKVIKNALDGKINTTDTLILNCELS